MNRIKSLIHVHTDYSYDSNISLSALARFVEAEGFGCVAVTDHDTIEGALLLRSITGVKVVVGEEVTTRDGHLIGLFLKERVRPGLSARDTAAAIRDQGGLVLLPHPFVKMFACGLGDLSWELAGFFDAVEVNNAQNLRPEPDRLARRFARAVGLPEFAGADTHLSCSIAPCYQVMDDFNDPAGFLEALRSAELIEGRHPLSYFFAIAPRAAIALAKASLPRFSNGASARSETLQSMPRPQPVMT